ncbi:MAG: LysR family transcriptional regulator [Pseudomonadota bacterium]
MDTRTLALFVDVAHSGSFAATARRRNLDPSSVSRSIAALETEFGTRLFQRSTRQLSVTEAGQRFLQRIEPILQELAHAQDDALSTQSEPRGKLKLSASVAFGCRCIIPLLNDFQRQYPLIELDLDLTDQTIDLVSAGIDLAVRLGPPPDVELVGAKLMDTHYRVCVSPSHLMAAEPIKQPHDLLTQNIVSFALPAFRKAWTFRSKENTHQEIEIVPKTIISNALGLRQAILAGLGVGLLPDWLIDDDVRNGKLIALLPEYDVTATTFETAAWLLYPSRSFLPRKTRVMIDFLKTAFPGKP